MLWDQKCWSLGVNPDASYVKLAVTVYKWYKLQPLSREESSVRAAGVSFTLYTTQSSTEGQKMKSVKKRLSLTGAVEMRCQKVKDYLRFGVVPAHWTSPVSPTVLSGFSPAAPFPSDASWPATAGTEGLGYERSLWQIKIGWTFCLI